MAGQARQVLGVLSACTTAGTVTVGASIYGSAKQLRLSVTIPYRDVAVDAGWTSANTGAADVLAHIERVT